MGGVLGGGDGLTPRDGDLCDQLYDGVYYVDRERTITFWNRGAELISGFPRADVVGRRCYDNILRHVDDTGKSLCRDGCPLLATILDGEPRQARVYLHHKDGHRQPVSVRTIPLRDAHGEIVGGVEVFHDDADLVAVRERMEELQRQAVVDPLTGIGNRRYGEHRLRTRLNDLRQQGWSFGLLFIDIDHFKKVNDRHGHDGGDAVLKAVAHTIAFGSHAADSAIRWGGEELCLLVDVLTGDQLTAHAERVRALVERSSVEHGGSQISVTISVGAAMARPEDTLETLVDRADRLMYQSKANGRNRVTSG